MRSVSKIVVKGAVDVVFFRAPAAHLVVAGENQEAIRSVKTRFDGNKLVIEQEGVSISGAGGSIHVSGSGNIVALLSRTPEVGDIEFEPYPVPGAGRAAEFD